MREHSVDVASRDENGDGFIYQCPMHPQVISDEGDNYPLCQMKLEEYSVAVARKNLTEHKQ